MKILFFVGKGGVGKSTSSALFSVKLAAGGNTVFLNSIDPAHNLHDIFKTQIGSRPKEVLSGLTVMETDLGEWVKKYLKDTQKELKSIYKYQQALNLQKYFKILKYSPGIEEYAVLLALEHVVNKNSDRDYIVFDTPPTALTLRFLALPSVSLHWLMELSGFRQIILDKKDIMTKIRSGKRQGLAEKDPVLLRITQLLDRYSRFAQLLKDLKNTRIIVVLNPDRLSLAESISIKNELEGLGITIPFVIVNKYGGQSDFLSILEKEFTDTHIGVLEKQREEIRGTDMLSELEIPIEAGLL